MNHTNNLYISDFHNYIPGEEYYFKCLKRLVFQCLSCKSYDEIDKNAILFKTKVELIRYKKMNRTLNKSISSEGLNTFILMIFKKASMVKVSIFIGTSLDGFIARENGDIGWLDDANKKVTLDENFGFKSFLESVDQIIMGRKTFEQVMTFDNWPYNNTKMIVLTSKNVEIPEKLKETVTTSNISSPKQLVKELSYQSVNHIYVDGGMVIQDFLSARLVDEITVTIVPVLIGKGKSFSGLLSKDLSLQHLKTTVYNFGFVQNKYKINK